MNIQKLASGAAVFVVLSIASVASAGTVQWSGWQFFDSSAVTGASSGNGSGCWGEDGGCTFAHQTIQYSADAVNPSTGASVCNSAIPIGATVNFNFAPHTGTDSSWFMSGYSEDSPYIQWSSEVPDLTQAINIFLGAGGGGTAGLGTTYTDPTFVSYFSDASAYNNGLVRPPTKSVTGVQDHFACGTPDANGSVGCVAQQGGVSDISFTFAGTQGGYVNTYYTPTTAAHSYYNTYYLPQATQYQSQYATPAAYANYATNWNTTHQWYVTYGAQYGIYPPYPESPFLSTYELYLNSLIPYTFSQWYATVFGSPFSVPAQTISCPITVTSGGQPPVKPTLTHDAQCIIGQPYSVTVTATDPQNDPLYYKLFWLYDIDTSAFQRLPGSGTVASGVPQSASHTYSTPGTHQIRGQAVDSGGNASEISDAISVSCTCPSGQYWSGTQCVSGSCTVSSYTCSDSTHRIDNCNTITACPASQTCTNGVCGAPGNNPPTGHLDSAASCDNVYGWAYDPDVSSQSIAVHFYVNGVAGSGTFAGATTANTSRPDVNTSYGITGNHGFSFNVPAQFRDGIAHSIYPYAIDSAGGNNPLVGGAPQNFTCTSCTDHFYCQGNDLYRQLTDCSISPSSPMHCTYGCAGNACLPPPQPTITLTTTPALVRNNLTTQVTWSSTLMSSCTVTATNGGTPWTGTTGTQTSLPIRSQTIFTARCIASGTGVTYTKSATVNKIPTFCEPGASGC